MAGIREKLEVIFGVKGVNEFKKGFKDADKTVQASSKSMTNAFKRIGQAAKVYLTVQVVKGAAMAAFNIAKLADQSRVLETSFDRLAKSVGQNSNDILNAMRRGMGGAVKDMELMQRANQAILLGLPVPPHKWKN